MGGREEEERERRKGGERRPEWGGVRAGRKRDLNSLFLPRREGGISQGYRST